MVTWQPEDKNSRDLFIPTREIDASGARQNMKQETPDGQPLRQSLRIKVLNTGDTTIPYRLRPKTCRTLLAFRSPSADYTVYINKTTVWTMTEEAQESVPDEALWILMGRVYRDSSGFWATIVGALKGNRDEVNASPGHVGTASVKGSMALGARLDEIYPALDKCGWAHSHPHGPDGFSPWDYDEQRTWGEHQIGLLLCKLPDHAWRMIIYRGPNGENIGMAIMSPPECSDLQTSSNGEVAFQRIHRGHGLDSMALTWVIVVMIALNIGLGIASLGMQAHLTGQQTALSKQVGILEAQLSVMVDAWPGQGEHFNNQLANITNELSALKIASQEYAAVGNRLLIQAGSRGTTQPNK